MRDFFQGWRRKAGCVTLVMACLFTGRWVSGHSVLDTITIFARNRTLVQLISRDATIAVRILRSELPIETYKGNTDRFLVITSDPNSPRPGKLATSIDESTLSALGRPYTWTLKGFGFGIGNAQSETDVIRVSIWKAPYWSIATSLTLISVYLLLCPSKRKTWQAKMPPETRESISDRHSV